MPKFDFDAVIVGGGIVGAITAKLLADQDWQVCLLDQHHPKSLQQTLNTRVVAISPGSQRIMEKAGIWSTLDPERLGVYRQMQVESQNQTVQFSAQEHGLPELGWIVETDLIQNRAWDRLADHPNVVIKSPAQWHDWSEKSNGLKVRLVDEHGDLAETISAQLLIAADGTRSALRQSAEIETTLWDYNQVALIGPVVTGSPNQGMAWQRFTDWGPLALLPLPSGYGPETSSIVWSIPSHEHQKRKDLSNEGWIEVINNQLSKDSDLGPMGCLESIKDPKWVPLKRQQAQQLVKGRLVLVGDAAHSVHPLAGQGLNVGIADTAALAESLADFDSAEMALKHYQRWRLSQSTLSSTGIHLINELQRLPLNMGRLALGGSFWMANQFWPIRERLIQIACGIDHDSPKSARL